MDGRYFPLKKKNHHQNSSKCTQSIKIIGDVLQTCKSQTVRAQSILGTPLWEQYSQTAHETWESPSPYRLVSFWPQMVVTSLMSLLTGHGPERLNISRSCLHGGCSEECGPGLRAAAQKEIQNWSREAEDSPRVSEKGNTHSRGKSSSKSESPPVPGWLSHLQRLLHGCIPQTLLQDRSGIYVV